MNLRPYQIGAIEAVKERWLKGRSKQLISLPTGLGKTVIFSNLAKALGITKKILILAHREELLDQAAKKYAKWNPGVRIGVEKAERRAGDADVVIASVQTLRKGSQRLAALNPTEFGLLITDECFPAGTLIDGKPIEKYAVGDEITAYDEATKRIVTSRVMRLFNKKSRTLLRIKCREREILCTPNHPFLTTEGWCAADKLHRGSALIGEHNEITLHGMQHRNTFTQQESTGDLGPSWKNILQSQVFEKILFRGKFSDNGDHQSQVCFRTNDEQEPDAQSRRSQESKKHFTTYRAQTQCAGRKWEGTNNPRGRDYVRIGLEGGNSSNQYAKIKPTPLPFPLQDRRGECSFESGDRSGRGFSRHHLTARAGRKEGKVLGIFRVDSVEIYKPTSINEPKAVHGSYTVYNLEVEKYHTYIANGFVVHNCHHATSDSYTSIYEHMGVLSDGGSILHCGLTATPNRADGKGLHDVFTEISYSMDILTAIKEGWLANLRAFKVVTGQSLDGVRTRAGDFATDDLAQAINNAPRNEIIVKHWKELAENRTTLAFCADIKHAQDLAAHFNSSGIPAAAVWGDDPLRAEKLEDLTHGKIKVLCNCAVLTEGFDEWRIGCVVMARPTKSQLLFVQCVGRGTRIPEGVDNLVEAAKAGVAVEKRDCIVLDVVDSCRNSIVTLPTLFGLGERLDMKGKDILKALEKFEEVQEEHPQADLKDAEDIETLDSYATNIDLFVVKWADEVLEGSTMQWHRAPDGHYVLRTKERRIEVFEDLLQKWNVRVTMGEKAGIKGELRDLPAAFSYAESYVRDRCPKEVTLVSRTARWHKDPASEAQIRNLKRFRIPIKPGLTKGEAQLALSKLFKKK
jgi:superfamily II DNA or RNA helicase